MLPDRLVLTHDVFCVFFPKSSVYGSLVLPISATSLFSSDCPSGRSILCPWIWSFHPFSSFGNTYVELDTGSLHFLSRILVCPHYASVLSLSISCHSSILSVPLTPWSHLISSPCIVPFGFTNISCLFGELSFFYFPWSYSPIRTSFLFLALRTWLKRSQTLSTPVPFPRWTD